MFHDPDGPYLGVVNETVSQGMPEKGMNGFNVAVKTQSIKESQQRDT